MKAIINIKADKEVKEDAQRIAEELGLSLSAVMNAYLKQFVRTREVHVSIAPRMTPELEAIIEEAEEDLRKNRNISPVLKTPEEVNQYLHSL